MACMLSRRAVVLCIGGITSLLLLAELVLLSSKKENVDLVALSRTEQLSTESENKKTSLTESENKKTSSTELENKKTSSTESEKKKTHGKGEKTDGEDEKTDGEDELLTHGDVGK